MCVIYWDIWIYCVSLVLCACVLISQSVPHITKWPLLWQPTVAGKLPSLEMSEWIKDKWLSTDYLAQRRWRSVSSNLCVRARLHTRHISIPIFWLVANEELHVFYHIPELQMCDWGNIYTASSTCDLTAVEFQQCCYTVQKAKFWNVWKTGDF